MCVAVVIFCVLLMSLAQHTIMSADELVYVTAVAWSHDGSKIAAVGIEPETVQGYLRVVDAETGEIIFQLDPNPGGFTTVQWSPDNRFIAAGGFDQVVWVIDAAAGKQAAALWGHQSTISAVAWNADGTRLVSAGSWDQQVILWDATTYREIRRVEMGDPWDIEFSPDGESLAVGGLSGLYVLPADLDLEDAQAGYRWADHYVGSLVWSADGSQLAYSNQTFPNYVNPADKVYSQLYVLDDNGLLINQFASENQTIFGIDWSADGGLIAGYSIDGVVQVWDAHTGAVLERYVGTNRYPEQVDFSPYGGRLAYGSAAEVEQQKTLGEAVKIVVPVPSLERLNSIIQACDLEAKIAQSLSAQVSGDRLHSFVAQIGQLNAEDMPLECAADLVAVAEAVIEKQGTTG